MLSIRPKSLSLTALAAFLVVAVGIQLVMITTMPIITTFDTQALLNGIANNAFPGFSIFAASVGLVSADTVVYLLACHGVMSLVICLAPIHLALLHARLAVALILGIALLASMAPFVFSVWLLNFHLYTFALVALVWCYGMTVLCGNWRYAIFLGGALWLAHISRPTGGMLFVVLGLAVVISSFAHREQVRARLSRFAVAGIAFVLLLLAQGYLLPSSARSGDVFSDVKARWLFCQMYAQSGVQGRTPLMLEGAPSLDFMAGALRKALVEDPTVLPPLIARWPEYFGRYEADGRRLAEDIIHNRQPMNDQVDHKFCWVVFSVLDKSFGADRANRILTDSWHEFVVAHPAAVVTSVYLPELMAYFFEPPRYNQVPPFSNDIGTSILGPGLYSEIYGIGVPAESSGINKLVYRYVYSVYTLLTPILCVFALLSLFVIFSKRRYAPVLLLCFGIVLYHGVATAISNVVVFPYVFVVYPQWIALMTAGLFVSLSFLQKARRWRLSRC